MEKYLFVIKGNTVFTGEPIVNMTRLNQLHVVYFTYGRMENTKCLPFQNKFIILFPSIFPCLPKPPCLPAD